MTYGFIGTGNMGGALARAAAKTVEVRSCIVLANRTPEKAAKLADEIGSSYAVRVASSDGLVQLSSFGSGVLRMSARELLGEVEQARRDMKKFY